MDIVKETQQIIASGEGPLFDVLPAYIRKLITEKAWEGRTDSKGNAFTSFEAFVECPIWHGLELTISELKDYCKRDEKALGMINAAVGALGNVGGSGANQYTGSNVDNINIAKGGTSSTYLLKRLKRDNPALADKVVSGELSANAAAIQAGIKAASIQIAANTKPESAAAKIREKLGDDFAAALKQSL